MVFIGKTLGKYIYTIVSISLFLLGVISVLDMKITGAIADVYPTQPWVDGRVYTVKDGKPIFFSSDNRCGSKLDGISVNDRKIDRCDNDPSPYYLIEGVRSGIKTYRLNLPISEEYVCDSWVAVKAENNGGVIASGNCTGEFANEAKFDNHGENVSLWWKIKKISSPVPVLQSGEGVCYIAIKGWDDSSVGVIESPGGLSNGVCYGAFGEEYTSYYPTRTAATNDISQTENYPCKTENYVGDSCVVDDKAGRKICAGGPELEYEGCLSNDQTAYVHLTTHPVTEDTEPVPEGDITVCPLGDNSCTPTIVGGYEYRGGDGIQKAIDLVLEGKTITVKAGVYNHRTDPHECVNEETYFVTNCTDELRDKAFELVFDDGVDISGEDGSAQGGISLVSNNGVLDLSGVAIHNFRKEGLRFSGEAPVVISDSSVTDNGRNGLEFFYDVSALVENSNISRNGHSGVFATGDSVVQVKNNTVYGNNHGGITFGDSASGSISENVVGYSNYGIRCDGEPNSNSVNLLNNLIFNSNNEHIHSNCRVNAEGNVGAHETELNKILDGNLNFVSGDNGACSVLNDAYSRRALAWGVHPEDPETFCEGQVGAMPDLFPSTSGDYVNGLFVKDSHNLGYAVGLEYGSPLSADFDIKFVVVEETVDVNVSNFAQVYEETLGSHKRSVRQTDGVMGNVEGEVSFNSAVLAPNVSMKVCMMVDSSNEVSETVEDNNLGCISVTGSDLKSDIVPFTGEYARTDLYYQGGMNVGNQQLLRMAVRNNSTQNDVLGPIKLRAVVVEDNVEVTNQNFNAVFDDSSETLRLETTINEGGLIGPGTVVATESSFGGQAIAPYRNKKMCLKVDADNSHSETNEDNNLACLSIRGGKNRSDGSSNRPNLYPYEGSFNGVDYNSGMYRERDTLLKYGAVVDVPDGDGPISTPFDVRFIVVDEDVVITNSNFSRQYNRVSVTNRAKVVQNPGFVGTVYGEVGFTDPVLVLDQGKKVCMKVDYWNVVFDEGNETDNTSCLALRSADNPPGGIALPDLTVDSSSVAVVPENPTVDDLVRVSFVLTNVGNAESSDFMSYVYVDPEIDPAFGRPNISTPPTGINHTIGGLIPNGRRVWDYWTGQMTEGIHTVYVWVDRDGDVEESNEDNNIYGPFEFAVASSDNGGTGNLSSLCSLSATPRAFQASGDSDTFTVKLTNLDDSLSGTYKIVIDSCQTNPVEGISIPVGCAFNNGTHMKRVYGVGPGEVSDDVTVYLTDLYRAEYNLVTVNLSAVPVYTNYVCDTESVRVIPGYRVVPPPPPLPTGPSSRPSSGLLNNVVNGILRLFQ